MARNLAQYTCYLIVFTSCVEQGHGRWKKNDKENLQHDIDAFKKMADNIEREIEAFYEDYTDKQNKGDDIENIQQQYLPNTLDRKIDTDVAENHKNETKHAFTASQSNKIPAIRSKSVHSNVFDADSHVTLKNNIKINNDPKASGSKWPKFDDILLDIGKKYDWKNDRWIKVKKKLKEKRTKKVEEVHNSINFYEKHKFSYRTVKLNRSKSRRNVVIAVTAVR